MSNATHKTMPQRAQARIAACLEACDGVNTQCLEKYGTGSLEQFHGALQRFPKVGRLVDLHSSSGTVSAEDWKELGILQREASAVLQHPRAAPQSGEVLS